MELDEEVARPEPHFDVEAVLLFGIDDDPSRARCDRHDREHLTGRVEGDHPGITDPVISLGGALGRGAGDHKCGIGHHSGCHRATGERSRGGEVDDLVAPRGAGALQHLGVHQRRGRSRHQHTGERDHRGKSSLHPFLQERLEGAGSRSFLPMPGTVGPHRPTGGPARSKNHPILGHSLPSRRGLAGCRTRMHP